MISGGGGNISNAASWYILNFSEELYNNQAIELVEIFKYL
jgi:hypothetical protein